MKAKRLMIIGCLSFLLMSCANMSHRSASCSYQRTCSQTTCQSGGNAGGCQQVRPYCRTCDSIPCMDQYNTGSYPYSCDLCAGVNLGNIGCGNFVPLNDDTSTNCQTCVDNSAFVESYPRHYK
jgi:hypothetical protein